LEPFIRPTLGDIVIWRRGPAQFHVSRFPDRPQFTCPDLAEAVDIARRVATSVQSGVLFTRDGVRFERV
jgi:hypothetical protein